ncbi:MAG TPA: thioredoxin family protein [Rhodanobacteraceae bacterium]|nr:thioredoxin family protein [Rhodanobacteraceae bacterium]
MDLKFLRHLLPRFVISAALAAFASACALAAPSQAPGFAGISHWINSPPLTMQGLRGKVVLIDFWTYSCINCLRSLPHVEAWYQKYKDDGLVVVGVHSPEFDFEKEHANVVAAVKKLGITYPVAQDDDMATWSAWSNRFWPAEYLVSRDGTVLHHRYGEGHYAETEQAIRDALGLTGDMGKRPTDKDFSGIGSPEMYFGLARIANLANIEVPARLSHSYRLPASVRLNQFALGGDWRLNDEYATLTGEQGTIRLRFKAGKLHMVAASDQPVTLTVTVDGKPQPAVTVQASRLYTLFDNDDYHEHEAVIRVKGKGFRAFTFTFG